MKKRMRVLSGFNIFLLITCVAFAAGDNVSNLQPVPFTDVQIEDGFWSPRMETNRKVTVPYDFKKCEETGRISNFAKAGGLMEGNFEGIYFNDSDLYKIIEGAAYSLQIHPDVELEKYVDGVIDQIASAQWEDGYLYTFYSVPKRQPEKRWTNERVRHELYCAGHFFEGAVAYYQATGKRKILDVAIRLADCIDSYYGEDAQRDVPGHQEIEMGLVRLYRVTGEKRYLKLAKFFLDERGHAHGREIYGAYCQDHKPVIEQTTAVGHAVRAGYMYSGMADVAALTGDADYIKAIDTIWDDVVTGKLYLTGGIGARHGGEAFGEKYELPNKSAYNETCAAIANAMWNHRLFLVHGDAKYLDVLERILYNGFLSGVGMSGDMFFYPNPLASDGNVQRSPWFGCSCCPSNVVRFVPSIPGYIYTHDQSNIFVNLFVGGSVEIKLKSNTVGLTQQTRYPWDGKVRITVEPAKSKKFGVSVRIPGWARDEVVPSDLYRFNDDVASKPTIKVNGRAVKGQISKGFAVIARKWRSGDVIELDLPMPIRRVLAHPSIKDDVGRVALQRGPIVYCAEAVDNGGHVHNLVLGDDVKLEAGYRGDLLGGVGVISGRAAGVSRKEGGGLVESGRDFVAIPYYAWAHRDKGEMAVWFAREASVASPLAGPTIASRSKVSASHCWHMDSIGGMNDQAEMKNSADMSVPRFTWWDHRGSAEWVQYDFEKAAKVCGVEVYWFDDTGSGHCRVPVSWEVLSKAGDKWEKVDARGAFGVEKDKYNRVLFDSVTTDGLKLKVQLQDGFSGGILEWRVITAK